MAGELLSVSENRTEIQSNAYDENGLRIRSGSKDYCYAGGMLIASGDTEYITDPYGNVVSAYSGDDYYVYSSDIQGSTACITDGDNISAEYEYSDFGEAAATADESFFNEICYTGAVYDNATGMYYMRARYYEPGTGRFITQDTYRGEAYDSNTWHLYAYCSNDPVNYTDPSGHKKIVLGVGAQLSLSIGKGVKTFITGYDFVWFTNKSVERYNKNQAFHLYASLGGGYTSETNKFFNRLKAHPEKILSRSKAKELIKGLSGLTLSVGFFCIFVTRSKFTNYKDYEGPFGTVSFSARNAYVASSKGKSNINIGSGLTTAPGMAVTLGGGCGLFNRTLFDKIKSAATSLKSSVERRAK